MRAALTRSLDDVTVVTRDVPAIGPGEILVAMKAVGICGSDTTGWYVDSKAPRFSATSWQASSPKPCGRPFHPGPRRRPPPRAQRHVRRAARARTSSAPSGGGTASIPAARGVRAWRRPPSRRTSSSSRRGVLRGRALAEPSRAPSGRSPRRVRPGESVAVIGSPERAILGLLSRERGRRRGLRSDLRRRSMRSARFDAREPGEIFLRR